MKNYHVGQVFTINEEKYILAQVRPYEICLINLQTGIRFGDKLEDNNISEAAMKWMVNGQKFELREDNA